MTNEEQREGFESASSAIEGMFAKVIDSQEGNFPGSWQCYQMLSAIDLFSQGSYIRTNLAVVNFYKNGYIRTDQENSYSIPKNIEDVRQLYFRYVGLKQLGPQRLFSSP